MSTNPSPLSRFIFAELCGSLPKPVDDAPETRAMRDEYAMQSATALDPMNAIEARLAVRIVAADAHAVDSLRQAALLEADPDAQRRCLAQAASMSRQSNAALRELLRIQATREKQEAEMHPAATERAGWWRSVEVPAHARAPSEPEPAEADIEAEADPSGGHASARRVACRPTSTSVLRSRRSSPRCCARRGGLMTLEKIS